MGIGRTSHAGLPPLVIHQHAPGAFGLSLLCGELVGAALLLRTLLFQLTLLLSGGCHLRILLHLMPPLSLRFGLHIGLVDLSLSHGPEFLLDRGPVRSGLEVTLQRLLPKVLEGSLLGVALRAHLSDMACQLRTPLLLSRGGDLGIFQGPSLAVGDSGKRLGGTGAAAGVAQLAAHAFFNRAPMGTRTPLFAPVPPSAFAIRAGRPVEVNKALDRTWRKRGDRQVLG